VFGAGAIVAPEGLRDLVETAYDREQEGAVPAALDRRAGAALAKQLVDRAVAAQNVVDFRTGYSPQAGRWESDVRTPTRLDDEPSVTLRLAVVRDGGIVPYADADEPARAWALSEVSVTKRRIAACPLPTGLDKAAGLARATWGRWEHEAEDRVLLAVMDPREGGGWRISARDARGRDVEVRYGSQGGLSFDN
jgi:CRISPR-associated endonuclease/helicase Cas3